MTDVDVVIQKIDHIQACLKRIHHTVQGDMNRLEDPDVQDITVLNLQRAIQLTIDLASHIVVSEQLGIPQTLKDNFCLLQKNKVIESALSVKMQKMVGFRNIAVLDYQAIDEAILTSIVENHLKDIEDFYSSIWLLNQTEP